MRRKVAAVLGMAAVFGLLSAGTSYAGIAGSKHDFSGMGWATNANGEGEICLPCHAPHNNADTANRYLWNHAPSTATFTFYQGLDMEAVAPTNIDTRSRKCMGCHDGTVAIDSFGGRTGSRTIANPFSSDLRNDHPISIIYDDALALADGELFLPSSTDSGLGGKIREDMLGGSTFNTLYCGSCHDVHNTDTAPGRYLLKKTNQGSELCLTCHDK